MYIWSDGRVDHPTCQPMTNYHNSLVALFVCIAIRYCPSPFTSLDRLDFLQTSILCHHSSSAPESIVLILVIFILIVACSKTVSTKTGRLTGLGLGRIARGRDRTSRCSPWLPGIFPRLGGRVEMKCNVLSGGVWVITIVSKGGISLRRRDKLGRTIFCRRGKTHRIHCNLLPRTALHREY